MSQEAGHHASRVYTDQAGNLHLNGASVFNANEVDIAEQLDAAGITGKTTSAADALAIPVTHAVVEKTTGEDAEALTLANGVPGQILTIVLVTDGGGNGTLTPVTKTGWSYIVFADPGDTASLLYVDDTVGWVILGLSGTSAPPACGPI